MKVTTVVIYSSCVCLPIALPWELLYADDLAVIAETEEELIKRLNEWKENVESNNNNDRLTAFDPGQPG